jgi:predicted transcriptional regulator
MHAEVLRQKTLGLHPAYRDSPIRLDEHDVSVLKRVNGQATVATIAGLLHLPDEVMTRIVLRLVARQKLVFNDELPWFDETALLAAVLERAAGRGAPRELRLDDVDNALLEAIDGQTRVRDVAKRMPIERPLVLVNVLRLLYAGLVRVDRAARPPAVAVAASAIVPAAPAADEGSRRARVEPGTADARGAPTEGRDDGEPGTDDVWGRAPASVAELMRRPVPTRWVGIALLVVGLAVAFQVARGLLDTVQSHLAGHALTVDGLADVIELSEIKLRSGRHWTGVARNSFAELLRAERVRAAQELVRRVRAAGFQQIDVEDESGQPLVEYAGAVLTIHEPHGDERRSTQ